MESAIAILGGLAVISIAGLAVWAVMWLRESRREEPTVQALKTNTGGGGGPSEPA